MGRVNQQKPTKQATATAPGNARGAKVAKQRKKHKVVLESSKNNKDDDDDKLRVVLSFHMEPPPGYTFIPAGNTQLTAALKIFAKKGNYKVMAVSATPHAARHELSREVHRIGYHFPTQVVDQVCSHYGIHLDSSGRLIGENDSEKLFMKISQKGEVVLNEKIRDQVTVNTEAKEIIQDLFPKIPNNDLFQIIKTAFQLGDGKVGTADEIPLVRRAQLAVVAHIRHVYTGYDKLLRQVPYNEARHMVERTTLRKLVEWRGDDDEDKDGNKKRAVDDAVREVVVLSDEDETESELEDGQVLENGDMHVEPIQRRRPQALETQHRPLSAAEMSSEEDAPSGYRFVPQVVRRRPVTELRPDAAARLQSRYAVWDQVRSEYRAGVPLQEPAHVIARIPINEPTHSTGRPVFSHSGHLSHDPVQFSEPAVRYVRENEPQQVRAIRKESPPLVFRGADGKLYGKLAPRVEPYSQALPPQRAYTPPARVYPNPSQYQKRRSASPNPYRSLYHRRTPSLTENDGNILPSIEGPDSTYVSPSLHRNPFEPPNPHSIQPVRRIPDRLYDPRQPGIIDLTNTTDQAPKRRRLSSSPPSPYLRRTNDYREPHIVQQENVLPRERGQLIDLGPQPPAPTLPSYRIIDPPTGVASLSLNDAHLRQSPRFPSRHDGYSRTHDHNEQAVLINRDIRPLEPGFRRRNGGVMYDPMDSRETIRTVLSRDSSPVQYARNPGPDYLHHTHSPRYYVRDRPVEAGDIQTFSSMPTSRIYREEVVNQPMGQFTTAQPKTFIDHPTIYRHEPTSRTTYIPK